MLPFFKMVFCGVHPYAISVFWLLKNTLGFVVVLPNFLHLYRKTCTTQRFLFI